MCIAALRPCDVPTVALGLRKYLTFPSQKLTIPAKQRIRGVNLLNSRVQNHRMSGNGGLGKMPAEPFTPASFSTFGEMLKYLRRRERLTQLELSVAVAYSEAQITRLEKNQRMPDVAAVKALFVPALHLEDAPELTLRLLSLAQSARQQDAPAVGV